MVATKLHEVTSKGIDWAYGTGSAGNSPNKESTKPSNFDPTKKNNDEGYWQYASNSVRSAYDHVADLASYLYTDSSSSSPSAAQFEHTEEPANYATSSTLDKNEGPSKSPQLMLKYELEGLLNNPYSNVRGDLRHRRSSLSATRSLLAHVQQSEKLPDKGTADLMTQEETLLSPVSADDPMIDHSRSDKSIMESSTSSLPDEALRSARQVSSSENAQKLAEGSLRALRDLEVMEAVELHSSLQFWTERWERPMLARIEAGPSGESLISGTCYHNG